MSEERSLEEALLWHIEYTYKLLEGQDYAEATLSLGKDISTLATNHSGEDEEWANQHIRWIRCRREIMDMNQSLFLQHLCECHEL